MKLSYWQKLLYSSGSPGVARSYQGFGAHIHFLCIDRLGLKASLVGLGWSLYSVWNSVNGRLAGYWSDQTRTRWDRRIPRIAGGFIPVGLFFYLLWTPPAAPIAGGVTPLFVYFIIRFAFTPQGMAAGFILANSDHAASTGAEPGPEQPAPASLGIRLLTMGAPRLVVLACLAGYRLHGPRLARLRQDRLALAAVGPVPGP